jgi:hypothetical protein
MRNSSHILNKLSLILLGLSCTNNVQEGREIYKISYGTSFGMCIGYCINTLVLRPNTLKYTSSGWNDTIETKAHTDVFADWDVLSSAAETDKFFEMPSVFGCPDCADGGAEWIEIEVLSGKKHRVTFEYKNEPEEIKELVISLREKMEEYRLSNEN